MQLVEGIPVWGEPIQEDALKQMRTCALDARFVALMADHHVGYSVPIGGVVAYAHHVSPSGVGFDIACGNKAVLTNMGGKELRSSIKSIMDDVWSRLSFGVGRVNKLEKVDHELFDDPAWKVRAVGPLKQLARDQLGTIGGGNHFVDLFTDEQDRVWIGVHFGSRGLGHKIATHFIEAGGGKDAMFVAPVLLHIESELGKEYLEAMRLAGRYAYAGRDWVCGQVLSILGANPLDEVHNHHNFAWRETHFGEELWVVRKGATPAFPGQSGFVGATMGDTSVILEGVDSEESKLALYSTVHGAGRVLSRTQAKGKVQRRSGKVLAAGKVTREMMDERIRSAGVEIRGADVDESPHCYKKLDEVLEHHKATIRVLHRLTPVGVAMAGPETRDPYKD